MTPDELQWLAQRMRSGVRVRDRKLRMRVIPACFVGAEAVDWLLKLLPHIQRQGAVLIGNQMLAMSLIEHVTREHVFEDSPLLYRFLDVPAPRTTDISDSERINAIVAKIRHPGTLLPIQGPRAPPYWEDIRNNAMFQFLRELHPDLFGKAVLFCLPHASLTRSALLTRADLESHLFHPSPTEPTQIVSLNGKTATATNGEVRKLAGWPAQSGPARSRIFFRQLFSTGDQHWMHILCLQHALTPLAQGAALPTAITRTEAIHWPPVFTFADCTAFLMSFPECRDTLKRIVQHQNARTSAVIATPPPGRVVVAEAQTLISRTVAKLIERAPGLRACQNEECELETLQRCVTTFVCGCMHTMLWGAFCRLSATEDANLFSILSRLKIHNPVQQLGIRPELVCEIPLAVSELDQLCDFKTPAECLNCIKAATDHICTALEAKLASQRQAGRVVGSLATDDLLPFFILALVKVRPAHLHATIAYIETFEPEIHIGHPNAFHFANLSAAVEYLSANKIAPATYAYSLASVMVRDNSPPQPVQAQQRSPTQRPALPHPLAEEPSPRRPPYATPQESPRVPRGHIVPVPVSDRPPGRRLSGHREYLAPDSPPVPPPDDALTFTFANFPKLALGALSSSAPVWPLKTHPTNPLFL
eukprot:TRINITY_DN9144_c0_g1_i2.p1 TRINITY_DN9144_c0_g1~~TRINITY_DN9144_c0_g1_i2.p1  ORF type:complete len:713 (-),score=112.73 TRINITY_DN9144_c0_g1_i2:225-2165(-)